MRFAVDAMLARLGKWLRIAGHDTLIFREGEDWELARRAREEGRVIVTRDRDLHRAYGGILIESADIRDQIAQVMSLGIDMEPKMVRCPVCNGLLEKKTNGGEAPEIYPEIWVCTSCGKVYWKGSHWRRMRAFISGLSSRSPSSQR